MLCSSVFALLLSLCTTLFAQEKQSNKETAAYPVSILWPSRVSYPSTPARAGFILDVSTDVNPKDSFTDDHLVMTILTQEWNPKTIASKKFESTYGIFDLALVDVMGDGIEEFFLVTGENRGTNVREETLTVWSRTGKSFSKLLSVRVSSFCGISCHWEYERQFVDVNGDGIIDLRLILEVDPGKQPDHSLIPKEAVREYIYDKQAQKLVRFK